MTTPLGDIPGPTSHTYISQRLRLRYVDWGNRDAPLLVLVHGGRDHSRNWDWMAEDLRRDWHVIAPDLRGHGDSDHSPDGNYRLESHVYDLAQLIHQQEVDTVSIVGHSFGGSIAIRYTGLYPEKVRRICSIEGLSLMPQEMAHRARTTADERMRDWIDEQRQLSGRAPKRYTSIEEALQRMIAENRHLSQERARHLTAHGLMRNEDGTYSWKFDNYVRSFAPVDMTPAEIHELWARITCPTLLIYGKQSWATSPALDGRLDYFRNAKLSMYDDAGHWVHHDRHDAVLAEVRAFLA
jgi:pimeloyl-ACP methyl ester carboxylesterase